MCYKLSNHTPIYLKTFIKGNNRSSINWTTNNQTLIISLSIISWFSMVNLDQKLLEELLLEHVGKIEWGLWDGTQKVLISFLSQVPH